MLCTPPQLLSASEMKLAPYFRRSLRAGSCPFHQSGAGRHECSCGRGGFRDPNPEGSQEELSRGWKAWSTRAEVGGSPREEGHCLVIIREGHPQNPHKSAHTASVQGEPIPPHPSSSICCALCPHPVIPSVPAFPPESENAAGELGSGEPGKKNISYHKLKLLVQENVARDWTGFDQGPGGVWVVKTRLLLRQSE